MIKSTTVRSTRLLAGLLAIMIIIVATIPGSPRAGADPASKTNKMMLVLDSSGSMKEKLPDGSTKINAARAGLDTVIDGLPASQQVGLRVYGATVFDRHDDGACTDSQQVVGLDTGNRSDLKAAVAKYKPYGETPIGYALQQAGKDLGSDGQRTIVLVSDGEPTCAPDPCKVAGSLAQQGFRMRVEVVGLAVSGKARDILRCIARSGKGHYYDAENAADLSRALDTVATRAARPYQPSGKPVTGGTSPDLAPQLGVGDWIDRLGGVDHERGDLFYSLRRSIPGSTFHVSAALINNHGNDVYDGLTVELRNGDENCGSDGQALDGSSGSIVSVSYQAPGAAGADDLCADNEEFTLEVSRGVNHSGDGLKNTVPVEIRVVEEPPATNADILPAELPEVSYHKINTGTPIKITGGSSFDDAVGVAPGGYRGTIVPGELQLFAVPVDWGQHLSAAVHIDRLSGKLADEMDDGGPPLNVRLFSVSRAPAENLIPSAPFSRVGRDGTDVHAITAPVVYQGRKSNQEAQAAASQAGDFYVAVSVGADAGKKYELPYELAIGVAGKVRGKPEYRSEASSTSGSIATTPDSSAGSTSTATASDSPAASTTPTGHPSDQAPAAAVWSTAKVAGAVIGGIGLLIVAAGSVIIVVLLRRRRG